MWQCVAACVGVCCKWDDSIRERKTDDCIGRRHLASLCVSVNECVVDVLQCVLQCVTMQTRTMCEYAYTYTYSHLSPSFPCFSSGVIVDLVQIICR